MHLGAGVKGVAVAPVAASSPAAVEEIKAREMAKRAFPPLPPPPLDETISQKWPAIGRSGHVNGATPHLYISL